MTLSAAVLALLLRQPVCWADRRVPQADKQGQLAAIATAIADASPTVERAAYLVAIGWHESRWCLAVGSGAKRGGRGEGYWQLEGSHHAPGARSGLSLEATRSAALLASAQLQRSQQCGKSPAAVLTAYAGRPCGQASGGWLTLTARVRTQRWAAYELERWVSE